MWGTLTDKNNPFLERNRADNTLFQFPNGARVMDKKTPYWEVSVGVHNIFKFFGIDYVRRLNYYDHANISKWGIRMGFLMSF